MRSGLFFMVFFSLSGCSSPDSTSTHNHPKPDMNPISSIDLQGHRGARGLAPENTIPAFERALALGVTTLEMDVVISKDNQVVVSHEPWFSGHICSLPNGEPVAIEEEKNHLLYAMTYDQIQQYDCGIRGNARFPGQEKMPAVKPLLKDVISFAEQYDRGRLAPILYNIETKSNPAGDNIFHPEPDTFTQLLIDVLIDQGVRERTTIQSFDPRTLRFAHAQVPDISLALLVEYDEQHIFSDRIQNLGFSPDIYSPDYRLVDKSLIDEAHERGIKVIPWTINTFEEIQQLVRLGVDGIITDYPDLGRPLIFPDEN